MSQKLALKFSSAALACAAALLATGAFAQLKPPSTPPLRLGNPQAHPAAPAPAESPAPAASASGDAAADKEKAGALAAAGWLILLDRHDWGRAWDSSSAMFRGTVPLPAWMDGIPKLRDPLGTLVERKQAQAAYSTKLQGRPDGDYVSVIFDSKFDKKQVQEIVTTVRDSDGRWRVTGYLTR